MFFFFPEFKLHSTSLSFLGYVLEKGVHLVVIRGHILLCAQKWSLVVKRIYHSYESAARFHFSAHTQLRPYYMKAWIPEWHSFSDRPFSDFSILKMILMPFLLLVLVLGKLIQQLQLPNLFLLFCLFMFMYQVPFCGF